MSHLPSYLFIKHDRFFGLETKNYQPPGIRQIFIVPPCRISEVAKNRESGENAKPLSILCPGVLLKTFSPILRSHTKTFEETMAATKFPSGLTATAWVDECVSVLLFFFKGNNRRKIAPEVASS